MQEGSAQTASGSRVCEIPVSAAPPVVKYDAAGRLVDEAVLLFEAGLTKGVYVKKSESEGEASVVGVVDHVGNGRVRIRVLRPNADKGGEPEHLELTYNEYSNAWRMVYDAATVQDLGLVPDWPEHRAEKLDEHINMCAKSDVVFGLREAAAAMKKHFWNA